MKNFFNLLISKLTIGFFFSGLSTFAFAFLLRQSYLHFFELLPIKGELGLLDLSYLSLVFIFRFIISTFLEYYLEEKYFMLLYQGNTKEIGHKVVTVLNMDKSENPSGEGSSKGEIVLTDKIRKELSEEGRRRFGGQSDFIERLFDINAKMDSVLSEQRDLIVKLYTLKAKNDLKMHQEEGCLDISVPSDMKDEKVRQLSKQVAAIDRGLQNKFAEYKNLYAKSEKMTGPDDETTNTYEGEWEDNKKVYKELFEE